MAVKIILKNSSVEDRRPTAGQLENGEIALNYNEAGAFLTCKDTNGDIQQVGGVKINDTAPDEPPIQCLWFQPTSLTLFVFDGDNWLPVAGGGGGGGGGDIAQIIGNQGIDANEVAGIVTLDADLDSDGLRFLNSKIALNIGDGLKFESQKLATDWSTFPGGDNIDWDPVDEDWNVDLKDPVTIGDSAPDPVDENYFWWDSSKGELFVGYEDPSGDSYWVSASRPGQDGAPGADGADGVTVVVSDTAPANPVNGQIWHNSLNGVAYAYWSSQGVWVSM